MATCKASFNNQWPLDWFKTQVMTIGDKQSTQVFIHYYHPFLKHSIVIGIPPLKSQILLCIRKDLKQSKNSIIF
jgi:hypothetical protein